MEEKGAHLSTEFGYKRETLIDTAPIDSLSCSISQGYDRNLLTDIPHKMVQDWTLPLMDSSRRRTSIQSSRKLMYEQRVREIGTFVVLYSTCHVCYLEASRAPCYSAD